MQRENVWEAYVDLTLLVPVLMFPLYSELREWMDEWMYVSKEETAEREGKLLFVFLREM